MEDKGTSETASDSKSEAINKIDLSALTGFSFGTQWTPNTAGRESRPSGRSDGAPRHDGAPVRRDRRPTQRPENRGPSNYSGPRDAGSDTQPSRPQGDHRDRRSSGGGQDRGGPRRDFRPRDDRRPREMQYEERPRINPNYEVAFYAEDQAFAALVKAIRASCHTYELFEITRIVLEKPERFVAVIARKPDAENKRQPLFASPIDNLPFESEDEVVQHVMRTHLGQFFDLTEVEVEAPKGTFQFVNRCGFTGELLGAPNYHRYQNILQQHHAARLGTMPFERFRDRIETVKDPELVNQWLEKMKKITRYTWKLPVAEGQTAPTFDSIEEARTYLLANAREKIVRSHESIRFHGRIGDQLPRGELRDAIEDQLDRQRRFPLDTANALRGRLRREAFTIFKRGSKGVSYVCSVKRKFRVPGQTFSDTITGLIAFIEANPMAEARQLPEKHLGITAPASTTAPNSPDAPAPAAATQNTEEEERLKKLWMDLRWLVTEGYVTEYADGKLFAPPAMTPQAQKAAEKEEQAGESTSEPTPETASPVSSDTPPESRSSTPTA